MAHNDVPTTDEIRDAIRKDLEVGVQETIADGTTVRGMDPLKRIQALTELEGTDPVETPPVTAPFGVKWVKLIPGGAG